MSHTGSIERIYILITLLLRYILCELSDLYMGLGAQMPGIVCAGRTVLSERRPEASEAPV